MLSKSYLPFQMVENWYGVNAKDSPENMLPGEWDESSINIVSDPQGGVGSRAGFSGITTASIGSATAWCGFKQYRKVAGTDHYIGGADDGKLYVYASNAYSVLDTGLGSSDDDDRFRFATLDNICVIVDGVNAPLKYTGSGSTSSLGGTIATSDFCIESWRYMFMHSTVDPRLLYYNTTLGSLESGYTSFLNFDETPREVIGACKQGDDLLVFKELDIFRVQYTGSEPKFPKYRIPSKMGTVSHDTIKETPDGRVLFVSPDFNVRMIAGDNVLTVGDNIKKFLKDGVNARLKYAVAGMMYARNWYCVSFTYSSASTTNDKTLAMDYSRPYQDKWGKLQYPWFVFSIGANCFAEIYTGGKTWLYHGGYVGKMYKNDSGTNDDGSAFNASYKSKILSHGDTTLEKKYTKLFMSYQNKGDWDLDINVVCDDNADTQKSITQSMLGGAGYNSLWDVAKWNVNYWSSVTDIDVGRDIDRTGKVVQISMGTSGLNESWNVLNYTILAKGLRRGVVRDRESL